MLKWIFERVTGTGQAVDTPIGRLPAPGALDLGGLTLTAEAQAELLRVDAARWLADLPLLREHYARFGSRLPAELAGEMDALEAAAARGEVGPGRPQEVVDAPRWRGEYRGGPLAWPLSLGRQHMNRMTRVVLVVGPARCVWPRAARSIR